MYRLPGGASRPIPAYAGGVSLGHQKPESLVNEARPLIESGYKAIKLRLGDSPERDLARLRAVRKAFRDDLVILTDANMNYTIRDIRAVMPGLESYNVGWLEEPFPSHDFRSYVIASRLGSVPLALGENVYTRFEFAPIIENGVVQVLQPDLSKTGGITETLRIAALASAWKIPIHPHTAITGLNMSASIHFLASIENGGYFEADISKYNPLRDQLVTTPYQISQDGYVRPLDKPVLGVEVDEDFLIKNPVVEGPGYI